ncbi:MULTISPECIES: hypothetical protein [unclassified Novosphingobium]|uniref:hypothetical protein n=1 Tax=unclassified Novosphingobium TaxID=2644732 RepID=UPI00145B6FAC|nr:MULTISPECIES: hypothetical protein [unclassified Novosphingobium]MBB3654541.1 hypothetical protein [Novosphingobium sp. BK626]MBB3360370.1 hypothetical protein [Novosphingobium sp. BK256]MBB3376709.1 hypothetical protein [Novosphingobium sp. BK280]MBB3381122.1 hypothetical protein [Novosphingobium sp. BK258]MBB3422773.1 hypothetical protein [Novosphingobium sp. BK267]
MGVNLESSKLSCNQHVEGDGQLLERLLGAGLPHPAEALPLQFVKAFNGNLLPPIAVTPTTLSTSSRASSGTQNWFYIRAH